MPVPTHTRFAVFARVGLLPVALVLATVLGLGSYCEASDDTSLAWLFSGVLARQPVPSVPLYFHGWGHLLAAAYTALPAVAWLGALLGGLLLVATMLAFAVLDKLLRPYLKPETLGLVLAMFFCVAWLEHWLWFSYVRVALLLVGGALLYAAQRPSRLGPLAVGLAGLGAAWLMRPSLGVLAFGATLPAVLLLAGHWRRALPLVAGATVVLLVATGVSAWRHTPAEIQTQVRDARFARILDFEQVHPHPHTGADSLGTEAISLWILGDTSVINEALYRRAYAFDAADFWGRQVPEKLLLRCGLLVRDYFPVLLALLATAAITSRGKGRKPFFWPVQLGFFAVIIMFAGLLKLPPRLALPLLDFWLLTNLIFLLKAFQPPAEARSSQAGAVSAPLFSTAQLSRLAITTAGICVLLYGAKTLHRRQVLGQERGRHERALAEISRRTAGGPRVLAGTNDLLKSLSPFRVYGVGAGPTLMLSGWPSHDASQAALRQHLSGTPDEAGCLRQLAARKDAVHWVLSAETAHWLNRRFRFGAGAAPAVVLRPGAALAADSSLRWYEPQMR